MKLRIQIVASGEYPAPKPPAPAGFPPDIARALEIEIQRHMEGYGFSDVQVHTKEWLTTPGEFIR